MGLLHGANGEVEGAKGTIFGIGEVAGIAFEALYKFLPTREIIGLRVQVAGTVLIGKAVTGCLPDQKAHAKCRAFQHIQSAECGCGTVRCRPRKRGGNIQPQIINADFSHLRQFRVIL